MKNIKFRCIACEKLFSFGNGKMRKVMFYNGKPGRPPQGEYMVCHDCLKLYPNKKIKVVVNNKEKL